MEQTDSRNKIAVIGSGVAGCLAAYSLSSCGFEVTLFEERDELFSGTSAGAIQMHLGGLYSGNPQTAKECLLSAVKFKKNFPFATNERQAAFLVANGSEIAFDNYLNFYADLAEFYAGLPRSHQVFGEAANMFRILEPQEYDFAKNVQGGIATQEPGLRMLELRNWLLRFFAIRGVITRVKTEVKEVSLHHDRFSLTLDSQDGASQELFNQVINAGGYKTRLLDHALGDRTNYVLSLKAWNLIRASEEHCSLPPFFVVRGDYLHYSPTETHEIASLITATKEGSYLDSIILGTDPYIPEEWQTILSTGSIPNSKARQRNIIEFAKDTFMRCAQLEPIKLVPGVSVSYSESRQDRLKRSINEVVPGWISIVPTKATNALELAQAACDKVTSNALI